MAKEEERASIQEDTGLTTGSPTVPRRPFGHILRCVILLMGIFFHFLLVDCIPRSKELDERDGSWEKKYRKGLYVAVVGSGIVEGCAALLMFLVVIGVRRTYFLKIVGTMLLVLYLLGAVLNMVGVGIMTHESWDWKWSDTSQTAYRSRMVGVLIGEAAIATAGWLMILPDFGVLKDWSDRSRTFSGRPLGHVVRSAVLLLGVFFHFLLADCIPRSKTLDDISDNKWMDQYRKGLYLATVGSGVIEACAALLLFIVIVGARRNFILKVVGLILLMLYVCGATLNTIGIGMMAHESWDWKWSDTSQSAYRSQIVGTLMGEAGIATAGLLIVLPDFGILNNWE